MGVLIEGGHVGRRDGSNRVRSVIRYAWFVWLWVGLGCGWPAAAGELSFESLGDDFPQDRIQCVLRGRYGFLWLATQRGLIRFDGHEVIWYRHDPEDAESLAAGSVHVLAEDGNGDLLVGTDSGLCLLDREYGRFERIPWPDDEERRVWSLCDDGQGGIWVGTDRGLFHFADGAFSFSYEMTVTAIARDKDGVIWAGTNQEGLFRRESEGGDFQPVDGVAAEHIADIRIGERGVWFAGMDAGLWYWSRVDNRFFQLPGTEAFVVSDLSLAADTLWAGSRQALLRIEPDPEARFSLQTVDLVKDGLKPGIAALLADEDDLLWVATDQGGLERADLRARRFDFVSFEGEEVQSMAAVADGLWIGTKYNGVQWLERSTEKKKVVHPEVVVRDVEPIAGTKAAWVGTDRGLLKVDRELGLIDTWVSGRRVWRVFPGKDSGLWLGTDNGLLGFEPKTEVEHAIAPGEAPVGLSGRIVTAIVSDQKGGLWVGTYDGGLTHVDASMKTRHIRKDKGLDGLRSDDILHLFYDHHPSLREDALWIATQSGGLHRYQPETERWTVYGRHNGFPEDAFSAVSVEPNGMVWAVSGLGLLRFHPDQPGYRIYRDEDGLLYGGAVPGALWAEFDNNQLWLGGTDGLSLVHTQLLGREAPPRILITGLETSGQHERDLIPTDEPLVFGPEVKSFTLKYAVVDFRGVEHQQLAFHRDFIDETWVEQAGSGSINYTRYLSLGGRAGLAFKATDANGVPTEASMVIQMLPPWWMRLLPLWVVLGLAFLITLVYFVFSLRERRLRARLQQAAELAEQRRVLAEERAEVAEERGRLAHAEQRRQEEYAVLVREHMDRVATEIANDLHDGPLATLTGLGYRLRDIYQQDTLLSADTATGLEAVAQQTLPSVCRELRQVCGDLLMPDFRYGLIAELENYLDNLTARCPSLQVHTDWGNSEPELGFESRSALYRIARTLLKNVVDHSGAETLHVRLSQSTDVVILDIRDNGSGFQVPSGWDDFKAEKHYGMYMADTLARSRAGTMTVASQLGQGTHVVVSLPKQSEQGGEHD